MRDEEHASPPLAPVAHHREDPFRQVGRQRRGDLVEDEELRVLRERAREIEHPEHRQRQVVDELAEIEAELHRGEIRAHSLDRRPGQAQVMGDREVGDERGILEHRREPEAGGSSRGAGSNRLARDADRPGVGPDDSRQGLDERALARPVGAEQGVDLPGRDGEVGGAKGDDRPVLLRDRAGLEKRCLVAAHRLNRRRGRYCPPPPRELERSGLRPLARRVLLQRVGRPRLDQELCARIRRGVRRGRTG